MSLDLRLDGAVVLVTGGVRGVGAGITRVFLRAGATVITCARNDPGDPVHADGRTAEFLACDVREPDQVTDLVRRVADRHGRLDVVVNNAGGAPFAPSDRASPNFNSKVVALNLLAPLTVAQCANSVMREQDTGGAIIMISSVSAARPSPGTAAYGAAKAGVDSLTATLAAEWAPRVRVNSLRVGMVRTELAGLHYGDDGGVAAVAATIPVGRLAEPEEIGSCAAFLASPLASYVSGATLEVHGGGEVPAFLKAGNAQQEKETP
ncbi:NAD(P)-dependent dehydrogenase, short-chain alcohol dehydrogenase family [Amycolatopsis marina]|uniref:NAD(P)-dependent dehydrogenase, short-chain alcohol dehydrogenase family n=1 Tax=Amycolatopsis marina TaxID=490629 RepID=A0A1I1BBF7_9PSEU|nr:SDR family oxidoreductase [Amycolatopsis marina]SFB45843.1 NAD(P)-dependent dehydrogenase, short-chain alcohol dehydrogenase family [Amycolatopsis marina]